MDNDDAPVGRLLSRREAFRLFGALGLLPLARGADVAGASATSALSALDCVVRPAQTVGPYYVDEKLDRSDLRTDPVTGAARIGVPLVLTLALTRVVNGACTPFAGAVVDLWQCDAAGTYSDVRDRSFDTTGQKWLRGFQVAGTDGKVRFTTLYPGWYEGRTVHIHFKVRTSARANAGEFVSQLYFDDAYTDAVYEKVPSAGRPPRRTRNTNDGIFRNGGGQLTLDVKPSASGHEATFALGVQL